MRPEQTSVVERLRFDTDLMLRRKFMVIDEPVKANIRVGLLLEELDKLAEETALRYVRMFHSGARVVTASMDNLDVLRAPDIEMEIVLRAQINYVGNTSMEVGVRVEQGGDTAVHLASCYFTMVARMADENGERSLHLPPLEYVNEVDVRRSARAMASRTLRRRGGDPEHPTIAEYAMLHNLHNELDHSGGKLLLASQLVTSGWERTYPELDGPLVITSCTTVHGACEMMGHCKVQEPLRRVNESIKTLLSNISVADLAEPTKSDSSPLAGGLVSIGMGG